METRDGGGLGVVGKELLDGDVLTAARSEAKLERLPDALPCIDLPDI